MATVRIRFKKHLDEYRVPTGSGVAHNAEESSYYTNDKEDAIRTAQHVFGPDVKIVFWTCYR